MRSIALAVATVATAAMVAPLSTTPVRAQSTQLAQVGVEVDVGRPRERGVVVERRRPDVVIEEREHRRRPNVLIEERRRPGVRIETEGRRYRDW